MGRRNKFFSNLIFVILISFAQFSTVLNDPINKKNIVYDMIKVCPAAKFVNNSRYVAKCEDKQYSETFKDLDIDTYMCMLIYDLISLICNYESRIGIINDYTLVLPETGEEFDNQIKKIEPIPTEVGYEAFIHDFCTKVSSMMNSFNRTDIDSDKNLYVYMKYVKEKVLTEKECPYICHAWEHTVNPLCMILLWADKLFSTMKPLAPMQGVDENLPKKDSANPVLDVRKEQPVIQKVENIHTNIQPNSNLEENHVKDTKVITKQIEQTVKPSESKKSDDLNIKTVNVVHNQDNNSKKQDLETPVIAEVDKPPIGKDETNLHLDSNKNKGNVVATKPPENLVENPNVLQEEGNSDNEFSLGEEQNKKVNENEDLNEHDNADTDNKDAIDNLDDGIPLSGNLGNQHEALQDGKKMYPHSPIVKEEEESHFFTYFSVISLFCIGLYVGSHNKQKILAMVLEGRRSRRGRGSRRRPSTASYRKLDCNLEEAVTSQCNSNVTHVIY